MDGGLASAHADHESMLGKVVIDWCKKEEQTEISFTIPFGATATLYLPEAYAGKLCENGTALPYIVKDGKAEFFFESGSYSLLA